MKKQRRVKVGDVVKFKTEVCDELAEEEDWRDEAIIAYKKGCAIVTNIHFYDEFCDEESWSVRINADGGEFTWSNNELYVLEHLIDEDLFKI